MNKNFFKVISFVCLLILPANAIAQGVDPAFNPSKLIDDKIFADIQTFGGSEGVQKFLADKSRWQDER